MCLGHHADAILLANKEQLIILLLSLVNLNSHYWLLFDHLFQRRVPTAHTLDVTQSLSLHLDRSTPVSDLLGPRLLCLCGSCSLHGTAQHGIVGRNVLVPSRTRRSIPVRPLSLHDGTSP